MAFSEDPSVANCQILKKAGEDYIDAARKCTTLYPGLREEAEEAWAEWKDLDCSQYANNGN